MIVKVEDQAKADLGNASGEDADGEIEYVGERAIVKVDEEDQAVVGGVVEQGKVGLDDGMENVGN